MSKIKNFILFIPFIGLCCWALYYVNFVEKAAEVVLPVTGYDPRNLLSGHYIEFQIDWSKANCNQADWNNVCPKNDFKGVNRFYVAENKAKELERFINNNFVATEIVFAYVAGARPVAKELLINGRPWHQNVYQDKKKAQPSNQTAIHEPTRQELD